MTGASFGIRVAESLCPDCDAHQQLVEYAPGVGVLEIHHDDTCPTYQAMHERNSNA